MNYLYAILILLLGTHRTFTMEELHNLLPDLITQKSNLPCVPIHPCSDRVMANLPLMKVAVNSAQMQPPCTKSACYREISDSESEISFTKNTVRIACSACRKTFSQKGSFTRHFKTQHTHADRFKCPLKDCLQSYTTQGSLKYHIQSFHKLNPKTLKQLRTKPNKDACGYKADNYKSQAMRNAHRKQTRSQK